VRLSGTMDDLDSQLEEANNNAEYNQSSAHAVEEGIVDLKEKISALKLMVSEWEDL
jgi:hypothetical protein